MSDERSHTRPPVVLMINDQEWSIRSLESILGPNGYAVLRAYTGRKGLERARTARPDMIILDDNLPDMSGIELCHLLRQAPTTEPGTPIILTTSGPPSRQQRLAALRAGAWDFLGHPLDAEEILLRFDTYTRAKLEADRARDEGLLDQLTGLYNLQGLSRRARELGSQAYRSAGSLACVVLRPEVDGDDHPVEETMAVAVGRVAELLRGSGRASDAIGRVGNAEFAVFAPATDAEGAARLARRIAEALRKEDGSGMRIFLKAGYHGVADFRNAQMDPVDLMVRASKALRSARQNGQTADWVQGFEAPATTS